MLRNLLAISLFSAVIASGCAIAGEYCPRYFERTNTRVRQLSGDSEYYMSWNNGEFKYCGNEEYVSSRQGFSCEGRFFSSHFELIFDQNGSPHSVNTQSYKPVFSCTRGADGTYTGIQETRIKGKIIGSNIPISFIVKSIEKYQSITPSF